MYVPHCIECSSSIMLPISQIFYSKIFVYTIFVGQYTFIMSRVCVHQPEIGGTYLTLLNSCSNMGAKWTKTLVLYVVEGLTVKVSRKLTTVIVCIRDISRPVLIAFNFYGRPKQLPKLFSCSKSSIPV